MYQYAARLVRVIDGDTLALDLDLGFYQWRLNRTYRLARINSPELTTPEGIKARDVFTLFLTTKTLLVSTQKADSFDRWIVEVYANGSNASDWLVANQLAVYQTYKGL